MTAPLSQRDVVDALCRQSLMPFVMQVFAQLANSNEPLRDAWYLQAICHLLEQATAGQIRRALICLMPRALKSITIAVAWPCWLQGHDPRRSIMVATYSADLARQHAEHRRAIMTSDWYKRMFPATVLEIDRQLEIRTTAGGYCRGVSVGGTITGKGADFIILDDVMKADEAQSQVAREQVIRWFTGTILTRFNNAERGVLISMQQRVHEDDLPAHLIAQGYRCLNLPAIADRDQHIAVGPKQIYHFKRGEPLDPVRFPIDTLERLRLELGPHMYAAQYLQNPVSPEGNLVHMEHFRRYEGTIPREYFEKVVQSWDTAQSELPTADYSVGTTWGYVEGRWFLLDIYRGRCSFNTLKTLVVEKRREWRADIVLIEYANAGIGLYNELRRTGPFRPIAMTTNLDKALRFVSQSGQIEEGRVYLPAALEGLDAFLSELRAFPNGRHDDQVDTLTQLLEYGLNHWRGLVEERLPNGRVKALVRGNRPPLGPLPDWLQRHCTE